MLKENGEREEIIAKKLATCAESRKVFIAFPLTMKSINTEKSMMDGPSLPECHWSHTKLPLVQIFYQPKIWGCFQAIGHTVALLFFMSLLPLLRHPRHHCEPPEQYCGKDQVGTHHPGCTAHLYSAVKGETFLYFLPFSVFLSFYASQGEWGKTPHILSRGTLDESGGDGRNLIEICV